MGTRTVAITTPYITLDQLLKWAGLVMTGGEARGVILEGKVLVNGEPETRRGKKLRAGDCIRFKGEEITIEGGASS